MNSERKTLNEAHADAKAEGETPHGLILRAALFAAHAHRGQKRKGHGTVPYVNHVIEVAELLAREGEVDDARMIAAALLHDTVEDTATTFEEIADQFGDDVRALVEEMTDDKDLEKGERKRLQVEHAPHLSARGKQIKLADKVSNIRDIVHRPPPDWTLERRRAYVRWGEDVVAGCRGVNERLEKLFDEVVAEAWEMLEGK